MINAKGYLKNMKIRTGIILLCLLFLNRALIAQDSIPKDSFILSSLQTNVSGEGEVSLYSDALLYHLLEQHVNSNKRNGLVGYRIQLNQWSGQDSRGKATTKARSFLSKFPDFDKSLVYQQYEAPYYKLRVGDFRSRNEAFEFYNQVRKYFPNSYIVKTNIVYPKLIVKNDGTEIY